MNRQEKWDLRMLGLAEYISSWSRDPSTKIGSIITDSSNRIVSIGFNGFPQGISDDPEDYANREIKYSKIIHGEMNCFIFAGKNNLEGCSLYTYPLPPCIRCAVIAIQYKISRIVSFDNDTENERWVKDFRMAEKLYREAGIVLQYYHRN